MSASAHRRAFVLPVVVLLSMVAAATIAMLLFRHETAARFVAKQGETYKLHHAGAGLREMIDSWSSPSDSERLASRLDDDGFAFSMTLPREGWVRVFMVDGQGAALRDPSGVGGLRELYAQRAAIELVELEQTGGSAWGEPVLREKGPVEISVNAAPPEVIEAIERAVTGGRSDGRVAQAILAARDAGPIDAAGLGRVISEAGLDTTDSDALAMVLTTSPRVWRVISVTRPAGAAPDDLEYSVGLLQIREGSPGNFARSSAFLSWEQVDAERAEALLPGVR